MRWCRFNDGRRGLVRGGLVYDVAALVEKCVAQAELGPGDPFVQVLDQVAAAAADADLGEPVCNEADAFYESPVAAPTKVIGAPVNYHAHLKEAVEDREINYGRAVERIEKAGLFLKATTCLVGPSEGVEARFFPDRRTDHEIEVGVVIGREARSVPRERALDHVAGYALALDLTLRGTEDRSFRKSIDTYGVLGPQLITPEEIDDPADLSFSLAVNGEIRQSSNTAHLVVDIPGLIAWASSWYTLHPGDVIMTGTPEGVGPLEPGDRMDAVLSGLMTMTVQVR